MSKVTQDQAIYWLDNLIENIETVDFNTFSIDEQKQFLSQQYTLLFQLNRAIRNEINFVGAKPIK